jgi:hypothetical protein
MICGLDEAGRGPLAGPVCAAAVILPDDFPAGILNDSKKLSSAAREKAKAVICLKARAWGIGWVSAAEIDKINIHNASLLAMERAFEALVETVSASGGKDEMLRLWKDGGFRAIADGRFAPRIPHPLSNAPHPLFREPGFTACVFMRLRSRASSSSQTALFVMIPETRARYCFLTSRFRIRALKRRAPSRLAEKTMMPELGLSSLCRGPGLKERDAFSFGFK